MPDARESNATIPSGSTFWLSESGDLASVYGSDSRLYFHFTNGYDYACAVGEISGDTWTGQRESYDRDLYDEEVAITTSDVQTDGTTLVLDGGQGREEFTRLTEEEAQAQIQALNPDNPMGVPDASTACG